MGMLYLLGISQVYEREQKRNGQNGRFIKGKVFTVHKGEKTSRGIWKRLEQRKKQSGHGQPSGVWEDHRVEEEQLGGRGQEADVTFKMRNAIQAKLINVCALQKTVPGMYSRNVPFLNTMCMQF